MDKTQALVPTSPVLQHVWFRMLLDPQFSHIQSHSVPVGGHSCHISNNLGSRSVFYPQVEDIARYVLGQRTLLD